MYYRDIFLFFIGIVLLGLSILKIFPAWMSYIGLMSFIVMGVRLVVHGIKLKIATIPPRPSIEDLESRCQQEAEKEARKKFIEDELLRFKIERSKTQTNAQ